MKVLLQFLHLLFLVDVCTGSAVWKIKQNQSTKTKSHDLNNCTHLSHSLFRMKRNPMTSSSFGSNLYPILDASVTILSFAAFASLFTMAISRFIMNRPSSNTGGSGGTGSGGLLGSIVSLGQRKDVNVTGGDDEVMKILNKADRACSEWRKCMKKNFYANKNKVSLQECPRRPRSCSLNGAPQQPKPKIR